MSALLTLASLQEHMACNDITLAKLRKLSGIVASSERLKGDLGQPNKSTKKIKKKRSKSATLLRITGQSPFTPEQHVMERLRCNACGAYFTAKVSETVLAYGKANQKYGYSARAIIAIGKYGMGSPFYRQESLQHQLGVPITASTQFDQVVMV